jgi:ankyrin repeat protein
MVASLQQTREVCFTKLSDASRNIIKPEKRAKLSHSRECESRVSSVDRASKRAKLLTPLDNACSSCNVTNLDLVELLLKAGADPNSQDDLGTIPMMRTIPNAPGAAKLLLHWLTTDFSISTRSGGSFRLARLRKAAKYFAYKVARPNNPDRVQHQLLL